MEVLSSLVNKLLFEVKQAVTPRKLCSISSERVSILEAREILEKVMENNPSDILPYYSVCGRVPQESKFIMNVVAGKNKAAELASTLTEGKYELYAVTSSAAARLQPPEDQSNSSCAVREQQQEHSNRDHKPSPFILDELENSFLNERNCLVQLCPNVSNLVSPLERLRPIIYNPEVDRIVEISPVPRFSRGGSNATVNGNKTEKTETPIPISKIPVASESRASFPTKKPLDEKMNPATAFQQAISETPIDVESTKPALLPKAENTTGEGQEVTLAKSSDSVNPAAEIPQAATAKSTKKQNSGTGSKKRKQQTGTAQPKLEGASTLSGKPKKRGKVESNSNEAENASPKNLKKRKSSDMCFDEESHSEDSDDEDQRKYKADAMEFLAPGDEGDDMVHATPTSVVAPPPIPLPESSPSAKAQVDPSQGKMATTQKKDVKGGAKGSQSTKLTAFLSHSSDTKVASLSHQLQHPGSTQHSRKLVTVTIQNEAGEFIQEDRWVDENEDEHSTPPLKASQGTTSTAKAACNSPPPLRSESLATSSDRSDSNEKRTVSPAVSKHVDAAAAVKAESAGSQVTTTPAAKKAKLTAKPGYSIMGFLKPK